MDGTILSQGKFVAPTTIVNQIIQIPSNADYMYVYNYTQMSNAGVAAPGSVGVKFYWQRGMAAGTGIVSYYQVTTNAETSDTFVSGGFTLYDPSGQSAGALPLVGSPVAVSAVTNATRPVVTHTADTSVVVGSVVRMSNTAQTDVNGVDMVVGTVSSSTSFTLLTATNPLATAPGAIGGAGFYRVVNVNPLFYPRRRFVVNITQAVNPTVSTSVAHGLTPGQEVRFSIPAVSGMVQLNPTPDNNYLAAIVLSVTDDYNFVINVDTSAFTAFTWPTIAQQPSSYPLVIPFGEDTETSLITAASQVPTIGGIQIPNTQSGLLADATTNTGVLGIVLGTGGNGVGLTTKITGPAGTSAADVIYWRAGKSSYGGL